MSTIIDTAIDSLAKKVTGEIKPDDAMKYSQAALNLAHVKATNTNIVAQEKT